MLAWEGQGFRPSWFVPDRIENVRHDAPNGANMVVYTADGIPLFGRFVSKTAPTWEATLREGWKWR